VRLKVPDTSTDPDGGRCTECFNDFGTDLELGEDWQQYTFAFDDLAQAAGWGAPRPGAVDAKALYGIQWQVNSAGAQFDVWVDDVAFWGCKR
jgi:endoglucanase